MTASTGSDARIGVDGGASRSRCVVLDPDGSVLARVQGPPAAVDPEAPSRAAEVVRSLVRRAAAEAGIELPAAALGAGLAGAGTPELREAVARALDDAEPGDNYREATAAGADRGSAEALARRLQVVTDVEAARYDVFGTDPGIVVLAGTGAVTLGLGPDGGRGRADGWGPEAGDEGSGLDVARRGLRAALRAHDGRGPSTRLTDVLTEAAGVEDPPALARWSVSASRRSMASLAPAVIRAAEEGDLPASRILADAAACLGTAVRSVVERLGPWPGPAPVAAGGGLLAGSDAYRDALARSLTGHPVRFLSEVPDAARGAVQLGG